MRSPLRWSLGALLLGAAAIGCSHASEQRPARTSAVLTALRQPPSGGEPIAHCGDEKGVTEAQPPSPAIQPQATPAVGLGEERARVSQAVTLATQQIDRLRRMQASAAADRRSKVDAALGDLQVRREKVLQDMRELEVRGVALSRTATDPLSSTLDRDLGDLQSAVHDSYVVAPPPGSGMAPPAPLPP